MIIHSWHFLPRVLPGIVAFVIATNAAAMAPSRPQPPLVQGAANPVIRAGFYHSDRGGPFGHVFFLQNETTERNGRLELGLRAAFNREGDIVSVRERDGAISNQWTVFQEHRFWPGSTSNNSEVLDEGTLTLQHLPSDPDQLLLTATSLHKNWTRTFRLKYLGTASPWLTEGARATGTLLAHRGSRGDDLFPENTMEAFDESLIAGFSGFELDVQTTADTRFAVIHDEKLDGLTTCRGKVRDFTLDQLKACAVRGNSVIPERISTRAGRPGHLMGLKDVFERFLPDKRLQHLIVDVKPGDSTQISTALEEATQGWVDSPLLAKVVFIMREPALMEKLHTRLSRARFALEGPTGIEAVTHPGAYIGDADHLTAHSVISLNLGLLRPIPAQFFNDYFMRARANGYQLLAWTINAPVLQSRVVNGEIPVDYLLTDSPFRDIAKIMLE